jgi:Toprim-like
LIADRPVLSLAELELHDPYPTGHGPERRFLCPLPACADHQRREHKNLTANIESGLWQCKRCGASGRLAERWERREVRPSVMRLGPYEKARRALGLVSAPASSASSGRGGSVVQRGAGASPPVHARAAQDGRAEGGLSEATPAWRRRWDQAMSVAGTRGESYLASRGIPIEVATAAGVRYLERWEHWTRDESGDWRLEGTSRRVVFPIVDKLGQLIGIQGRKIADSERGEKMLTNGHGGIFVAGTPWPLEETQRVAIVEAPIDALSLAAVGVPALATQGTSWPAWLPLALAFRKVLLAHDNDEPNAYGEHAGDMAASSLVPALRSYGAEPERFSPLSKDWNQDLQELGLEQLRRLVAGAGALDARTPPAEIATERSPGDASSEAVPGLAVGVTSEVCQEADSIERLERAVAWASSLEVSTAPADTAAEYGLPADRVVEEVVPALPVGAALKVYTDVVEPVQPVDRAEVAKLLEWLSTTRLPHESLQLWPWVKVVDIAQFAATLEAELTSTEIGPRWPAAVNDLRQLARIYGKVEDGHPQSSSPSGRAPPQTGLPHRTGAHKPPIGRVQVNGSRVG